MTIYIDAYIYIYVYICAYIQRLPDAAQQEVLHMCKYSYTCVNI